VQFIKDYIKENPFIYDRLFKIKRSIGGKDPIYQVLDNYSRKLKHKVKFVQIGANDGLRNDPVREFIVRDQWSGILVEPVPYTFNELKSNYAGFKDRGLVFVNAAIGSMNSMEFWTFKTAYLDKLAKEDRMDHLRKSSFSKEHVQKFVGNNEDFALIADSIAVTCLSFKQLIDKFWSGGSIDLLVIDAEGHEEVILKDMLDSDIKPLAIFYERHHLGNDSTLESQLLLNGYVITKLGGDAFAELL